MEYHAGTLDLFTSHVNLGTFMESECYLIMNVIISRPVMDGCEKSMPRRRDERPENENENKEQAAASSEIRK